MRDDLSKLPLPKSAKKYARMTSKDLGSNWSKKVDMYMDMAADLTNQSKEGFKNKDASGKVKHAFKENLGPEDMEQMTSTIEVEHRFRQFYKTFTQYFQGSENLDPIEAWMGVFDDANGSELERDMQGQPWGEAEFAADRGMAAADGQMTPDAAWNDVVTSPGFREQLRGPYDIEAAKKLFYEIYGRGPTSPIWNLVKEEDDFDPLAEAIVDRLLDESIKAAAVKCHDGTVIAGPPGADHIACCMMANQQGKSWDDEGLGFVTHDDRFVDRNEAEIEGMRHGQLRPEISDPGMVHARDFYWNESRGGYRYETCCVNADGNDITDMVDSAVDVTYEEFMRNVPLDQIFASGIGYGYDWPPAKLIVAGIDPHEVGRQGLTLKKDWHVSYHKSTYQGRPCYFMCHSAIEYVFVKD